MVLNVGVETWGISAICIEKWWDDGNISCNGMGNFLTGGLTLATLDIYIVCFVSDQIILY